MLDERPVPSAMQFCIKVSKGHNINRPLSPQVRKGQCQGQERHAARQSSEADTKERPGSNEHVGAGAGGAAQLLSYRAISGVICVRASLLLSAAQLPCR